MTSTPTTDIVVWTAVVHNRAEKVVSTMDCQTDMFGLFIGEMCKMRVVVDHVSMSTASLSWAATFTVANQEADGKEEQEGDDVVDVTMGEVGDESGGGEEEEDDDDDDDEEGEEEKARARVAERDTVPEASASQQVAEWPHVPCPQWRPWKDKGKNKMQWEK
jgi:hypothetical protein